MSRACTTGNSSRSTGFQPVPGDANHAAAGTLEVGSGACPNRVAGHGLKTRVTVALLVLLTVGACKTKVKKVETGPIEDPARKPATTRASYTVDQREYPLNTPNKPRPILAGAVPLQMIVQSGGVMRVVNAADGSIAAESLIESRDVVSVNEQGVTVAGRPIPAEINPKARYEIYLLPPEEAGKWRTGRTKPTPQ